MAVLVALFAATMLVFSPMAINLAIADVVPAEQLMPCHITVDETSHQAGAMDAGGSGHGTPSCPTMLGAQCLTLVGMLSPAEVVMVRLMPSVSPTPAAVGAPPSRAVSPPHRPPKHA